MNSNNFPESILSYFQSEGLQGNIEKAFTEIMYLLYKVTLLLITIGR